MKHIKQNHIKNLNTITITAMGIALYAVLSMTVKIPLIGHIALDLGYIVLAIYSYHMGAVSAAIVGGCGAAIISVLTGWFAPGWVVGNCIVGLGCGFLYNNGLTLKCFLHNTIITIIFVILGIFIAKTIIECSLYSIPYLIKMPKNLVATIVDAAVMCIGIWVAPKIRMKGTVFYDG